MCAATSLLSNPGISKSTASPLQCCDLADEPIASDKNYDDVSYI